MYRKNIRRRALALSALGAAISISVQTARADVASDASQGGQSLDPVIVTAQHLSGPQLSPSQGSLVATQPQSIVGGDYIHYNDAPASNYTDIIKLTPSVWTVDPNGPGLMENLGTSIRGFQDGQFNVTFDGIPWGDSNDFTHHSTSYFVASDIGNVVVDRGPGNAATLGDATFGGTVYVQSAEPKHTMEVTTNLSFGSFKTQVEGVRFDTGDVSQWGGARAFVSAKHISSDGYLTNANLDRSNVFVKIVAPLNDFTELTVASNLNKLHQNPPIGATPNQLAQYGANYGYNTDPTSQGYYGYNLDKITTDYEYVGITSKFSGWSFDNKLYTYAYYHDGFNGVDPGGSLPNGGIDVGDTPNGTVNPDGSVNVDNVPGNQLVNNYRSVGDIFRVSRELGPGDLQFGAWYDHQTNVRALYDIDLSSNSGFNYDMGPVAEGALPLTAYTERLMDDQLFTKQYYGQYVWHVFAPLDITGGLKHVDFERDLNATVNQKTGMPLDYSKTWTRDLPSLDAHYKIADNWSAYIQWSKGFLAPNLNVFYIDHPGNNQLNPESTTNVQFGTTWVGQALTLSADVYTINFSNLIQKQPAGTESFFYNLGGVKYKGAEVEGTYVVGAGFSVYANASYNSARLTTDDTWVPLTPDKTAALALLYKQGPLQGSLVEKYIGRRYGDSQNYLPLGGYGTMDGSINYLFGAWGSALKDARIGITAQNLANRKSIYSLNGYSNGSSPAYGSNGVPLFFTIPGRSFQVNLSASF